MTPDPRDTPTPAGLEQDGRFPSGPWKGFFLQRLFPGRQWMELSLTFREGNVRGEGRDRVGEFVMRGRYDVETGKCWWTKRYIGQHDIAYGGFNEGKGIWGTWEEPPSPWNRGGFHIWPEAMGDPTISRLAEEAELPATVTFESPAEVEELVPAGAPS
jgi:hypothetical protein